MKRRVVFLSAALAGVCCLMCVSGSAAADTGADKKEAAPLKTWVATRAVPAPKPGRLLEQPKSEAPPRNIVLIIGDGMGQGAYDLASLHAHGATGRLFMQQLPVAGLCETRSQNSAVTDSAAAGTAIACGKKTNNGVVGMTADGQKLKSIAYAARDLGKAVGVITSDALSGATPAAFFAMQPARGMAPEIVADASRSRFDILIGSAATRGLFKQNGKEPNQSDLQAAMETAGYRFIDSPAAFAAVPDGVKVVGQIEGTILAEDATALAKLTETAIARLARDIDGFFLMVESAYPDHGGHGNDPDTSILGTIHADWAAQAAVAFAAAHGDTLVICTADHETGALCAVKGTAPDARPVIVYGGTNHSGTPVPLYAFGPGAERFGGHIDNTDIARTIGVLWGVALPAAAN